MNIVGKWLKRLGLIFALPVVLVLVVSIWLGFNYFGYNQIDDEVHIAAKKDYLAELSAQTRLVDLTDRNKRPNIIIMLYDDLGYSDLGIFGSKAIRTPAIDTLARDGVMLTNFYAPSPICSPSRAGLLTGRFPVRAGLPNVVFPTGDPLSLLNILSDRNVRLPAEEITLADMLKAAGYSTGMVGKWHMGDRSPSLPNDMGFDTFFGSLYSNDMQPFALYRDKKIEFDAPFDQTQLNSVYTNEAIQFISKHGRSDQPFFLQFSHNFPHVPLYLDQESSSRSAAGLYGDVVEALDEGVQDIVNALDGADIKEDTIIIITSDNGPWWQGDASDTRGRKGQTWEGGMRVPFIVHWPARLNGEKIDANIAMGTDIFPTIADWLNLPLPQDRLIDGKSIVRMLEGNDQSPHEYIYYFAGEELMAIRDRNHKYLAERNHIYAPLDSVFGISQKKGPWLVDLNLDKRESYDVSKHDPAKAKTMRNALLNKRREMKENLRGWVR